MNADKSVACKNQRIRKILQRIIIPIPQYNINVLRSSFLALLHYGAVPYLGGLSTSLIIQYQNRFKIYCSVLHTVL